MTIQTRPIFYYIDGIDSTNNKIDFIEPTQLNVNLVATVSSGTKSMTNLMFEVQKSLNSIGANTYSVTFDRDTRLVTVSADANFNLLISSGANTGVSPWTLLGFSGDQTGSNSYVGTVAIGNTYSPQFRPQNFEDFDDNIETISPSVNESAEGIIEVISFGTRKFMQMNFTYITNRTKGKGSEILNNPQAIEQVRAFLTFAVKKSDMEFMKDIDDRSTFSTVLLESTFSDRKGTGFKLRELTRQNLEGFFETGNLKFRKV